MLQTNILWTSGLVWISADSKSGSAALVGSQVSSIGAFQAPPTPKGKDLPMKVPPPKEVEVDPTALKAQHVGDLLLVGNCCRTAIY